MAEKIKTKVGDSVTINITVWEDEAKTTRKDLTGATVEAAIRSPDKQTVFGTTDGVVAGVTNALQGEIQMQVPTGLTDVMGWWLGECEAVIGAESQTVWQEGMRVNDALLTD